MDLLTLSNGGKTGEMIIYDDIGFDWWTGEGITAKAVHEALASADKLEELTVRINSPGGHVRDGNAIYNSLHRHKAKIIVEVDSLAASAASVIAMAGDEINICKNAIVMIHEAWGGASGQAKDLETTAQVLRKVTSTAADVYAARTGRDKAELLNWMADEKWMTADEALELGFATKVHEAKSAPREVSKEAKARGAKLLALYQHAPESVMRMYGARPANPNLHPPTQKMTTPPEREASQGAPPAIVPTALGRLAMDARAGVRLGSHLGNR